MANGGRNKKRQQSATTPRSKEEEAARKQAREERRAARAAEQKKREAAQRRKKLLARSGGIAAVVAVVGLIGGLILWETTFKPSPDDIEIAGLQQFDDLDSGHIEPDPVDYQAEYGMNPPAGGDHHSAWLNCGIYDQPQPNENAVHSLEHGAVWVTYDPDVIAGDELETLRSSVPSTYMIVSPFPGLPSSVVASAWGAQVELDGIDDERLDLFIERFRQSPSAPEPGAACVGGVDGPGLVG